MNIIQSDDTSVSSYSSSIRNYSLIESRGSTFSLDVIQEREEQEAQDQEKMVTVTIQLKLKLELIMMTMKISSVHQVQEQIQLLQNQIHRIQKVRHFAFWFLI